MQVPKTPLVLAAVAFVLALAAGARQWQAHFRTVPVLRVRAEVPAGQPVPQAAVEVVQVPAGGRPEGALGRVQALAGRWARVPLVPGEILLEGHLTSERPRTELADQVQPGRRVLSIPVRPEAALQGALKPGDIVDAWAVFPAASPGPDHVQALAAGLRVMDVRNSEGAPTAAAAAAEAPGRAVPAAVLVEVTPEQAAAVLSALTARGEVFLLLAGRRSPSGVTDG